MVAIFFFSDSSMELKKQENGGEGGGASLASTTMWTIETPARFNLVLQAPADASSQLWAARPLP